jgi:DNA-binding NarL/FixJ family response regulator
VTFLYLQLPDHTGPARPRVMLVDDHGPLRAHLKEALAEYGIEVVAEADDGALATLIAPLIGPAVILMDVRMPGQGGIETTEQLRLVGVDSPVLILTGFPDLAIEQAALRAGASRVLVKGVPVEEIVEAIREAWARIPRLWAGGLRS